MSSNQYSLIFLLNLIIPVQTVYFLTFYIYIYLSKLYLIPILVIRTVEDKQSLIQLKTYSITIFWSEIHIFLYLFWTKNFALNTKISYSWAWIKIAIQNIYSKNKYIKTDFKSLENINFQYNSIENIL